MQAEDIVGKTVLVGLTYVGPNGVPERRQWHGVVVAYDESEGVSVRRPSGEVETLPPDLDAFTKAEPGEYTLRETGEVVTDPDLLATWTVTEPAHGAAELDEYEADAPWSDEDWHGAYTAMRSLYDAYTERLDTLVEALLDEEAITYSWVISFSVRPDAFWHGLTRARRRGQAVENPLESGLRVAGVTIGVETGAEAREIEELVRREFEVDPAGSLFVDDAAARTEGLRDPAGREELSYAFAYFLVRLDERRRELPEWASYAGLAVRIELVTLLQDAWRGIEVELPFADGSSYPVEVRDRVAESILTLAQVDAELIGAREDIGAARRVRRGRRGR